MILHPPAGTALKLLLGAGLVISAALLLGLALVPELGDLLPRGADQAAVAAVVERTIVANQSTAIPHQRDAAGRVEPATVLSMRAQVRAIAAELFTASYRDAWIERADGVIAVESASEFIFDGGAYDFRRWRIWIDADRATVAVRCRIFLEMAQTFDGPRHRAENIVDYELTLERVDGVWLVSGESQRFAPASGP